MLKVCYNTRLGRNFHAWLNIEYTYLPPQYDNRGHKTCPGYIQVHRVRVLCVEWDKGFSCHYKTIFGDWQDTIDALALDSVRDEVDTWGYLADYLVAKAT